MTDPPMYSVASAVFCRSLAIVRSLPLPGCVPGRVGMEECSLDWLLLEAARPFGFLVGFVWVFSNK